jgi:predicted nucleic acid-binding protein
MARPDSGTNVILSLLRPSPEALFLAGRAFLRYRQNRGSARMILPDFLIGAQAEAENLSLLTRDCACYQSYFPSVRLLCP